VCHVCSFVFQMFAMQSEMFRILREIAIPVALFCSGRHFVMKDSMHDLLLLQSYTLISATGLNPHLAA
jgi:hypothetical protein